MRKLRAKNLVAKRSRPPPRASRCRRRTVAALLAIRDQVIAPLLAEVRSPRRGRPPATWTRVDRDYDTLRVGMQTLFRDLGIATDLAAA